MKKLLLIAGLFLFTSFLNPLVETTGFFSTVEATEPSTADGGEDTKKRYKLKLDTFTKNDDIIEGDTGVELWKNFTIKIYKAAAGIIGIICVLIIVFSGIQISLGGLSSEGVNQAKERIIQALLSLILLFGASLLLRVVNPGFFGPQEIIKVEPPSTSTPQPSNIQNTPS